ncbi:MAG: PhzF family phenazine biosynthesis protein [Bdellovibrionota bacterium]
MKLQKYYEVNAFCTRDPFSGNPAGICPLDEFPDDSLLLHIAAQNNLSETAFFVKRAEGKFDLRWFTPTSEVDLCGHATLASGWLLFNLLEPRLTQIDFATRSGTLSPKRAGERIEMSLPARPGAPMAHNDELSKALGVEPIALVKSRDILAVLESEEAVRSLKPNLSALAKLHGMGIIATAPGSSADFVSRAFFPAIGINEDPVTGSAHCTLVPYWAEQLKKTDLRAEQVSTRGGDLHCELAGDSVILRGKAELYLRGELLLP